MAKTAYVPSGVVISCLRVSYFRSLKNVELKLDSLTVLVGANNAGKTTVLDSLQAAIGAARRALEQGKIEEVGNYCETDVIATYLIFLRLSLVTGDLQPSSYRESLEDAGNFLSQRLEKRPHLERIAHSLSRLTIATT